MDGRSIRNVWPTSLDPVVLAAIGTAAAFVKLVGNVIAAWCEARIAGEIGADVRRRVLADVLAPGVHRLRAPRQIDHGAAHSAATSAQRAPERGTSTHSDEPGSDAADLSGSSYRGSSARATELAALTSHVGDVERGIVEGVFAEIRAVLQLVPLSILLFWLAPRSASFALLLLGGFGLALGAFRRSLKRGHARAAEKTEALLGAADEAVRHAELWSTYGAEDRVRSHVARLGESLARLRARLRAGAALLSGTSEALGALALLAVLGLVATGWIGDLRSEGLVPFAVVFFMAYRPLRDMADARLAKARAYAALERTASLGRRVEEVPSAAPSSEHSGEVEAHAVLGPASASAMPHAWEPRALVVDGLRTAFGRHGPVSFRVPFGSVVAIVGPTGIGKTSLFRALLGLDAVRAGTVRWGDRDLTRAGVGPSERPFAWVPQDAPVLADTIEANVMLGDPASGRTPADARRRTSEVLEELGNPHLAGAIDDAVLVAERNVSGGERQWIAVARALASELPVVLLDEPTSALDPSSQARMLAALGRLRGARTIVVVTHRPEPLAIADVVVRLDAASTEARTLDDAQGRAGGDGHVAEEQIAVEDVGALAVREADRDLARERVDARSDERSSGEHERHLRSEPRGAERRSDHVEAVGTLGGAVE